MEGIERGSNVVISSMVGDENDVVQELMGLIETVGSYSGYIRMQKKECLNLVRRLKLLVPLLEEIREIDTTSSVVALNSLINLKNILVLAKKLLKTCSCGSKIYLVSICSFSIFPIFWLF